MRKLKFLLLALAATISVGAWAETDVTNLLNDAVIESEANWGGGNSSGGNHNYNTAGYWESWHNTFNLTQTINSLDAGYYMVSIQGVVEGGSTTTAVLTATSGENTATAYLRNNTRGDFNENALALKASPNLHRSYATVKVAKGGSLTISFKQTANNQWIVYGQFKLHKLTAAEGINQQALENALSGKSWGVTGSTNKYHGLNENYSEKGGIEGDVIFNMFEKMPKGIYEVSATAAASYTSGRDFDGKTGDNLTVFRANGVDVNVPVEDRGAVDYSAYGVYTAKCSVGDDGILKFGLYNLVDNGGNWFVYGVNNIVYENLESALTTVRSKAKAIIDAEPKMNSMVWNNLNTEYSNSENVSEDKMSDAIESLDNTIDNANASIAIYASIQKWYDDAKANLSDEGYNKFVEETSEIKSAYDDGTITDGVEENATLKSKYEEFIKIYYAPGADITDIYIKNAKLLNGKNDWNCDPNEYSDYLAQENNGHIGVLEFYAGWGSYDLKQYSMTQKIKLPAGEYKLSSNAFYRYGEKFSTDITKSEAYMVCGTNRTVIPTLGSISGLSTYANDKSQAIAAFEDGLYETSRTFKLLEDNTEIEIGYTGTHSIMKSWFISGPLKLVYVGPVSVEGYIEDLKTALASVPTDKMQKSYKEAIDAAVTTANNVLADYEKDPKNVSAKDANDACEALRAAIIAAEPSIAIYKQIALINTKAESLDADGKKAYSETLEKYNNGELSTLAEAQAAYIAAVKAQTTSGANMTDIITNAAVTSTMGWNNARVNSGQQYTGAPDNTYFDVYNETRNMTQNIGVLKSGLYTLKCATRASADMTKAGNIYVLQNGSNLSSADIHKDGNTGGSLGNGWSWTEVTFQVTDETNDIKIGFYAECDGSQWAGADNFTLTFVGKTFDATMTKVGDAAYSSMYLDYPVEIPESVKAYYVTVEGRTATMNEIEGVIPANCGVILKAAEDVDKITFTQTSTEATTDVSSNVLIGFVKDTEVEDGKAHYAFSYKTGDTKPAFYIPESAESDTDPTSKFTAKAHKAYIELESAPNSKLDITWGGEATGINTIDNGQLTIDNSKAYNLNGMRVNPSTGSGQGYKGIVLKGGKKFLQK